MEVNPGYKQTEMGVIPEDWEVSPFSRLFNITAGGDVDPKRSQSFQDSAHPHPIYSNALTNSGLYGYCSYADHPANSITITARGMVGGANFRDHPYTAIGRVLVLQPKSEMAGFYFAEVINNRVKFANESTGVPQLTAPQISKYRLPVPSPPEQHAIATALSDVDGLLGGLDRLIAKKRDLKQAAIQQLLTGQTRLPGFENQQGYKQTEVGVIPKDWGISPMREFGKFAKGIGLLKEDIGSFGCIPAIPYTSLYTDFSEIIDYDKIKWFVDDSGETYLISEPCVLIASSSNMAANTGKACALTGNVPVAVGREVIIFRIQADCRFVSYLLSTPAYRKQTLTLARGTTIKHLYPATFQDYRIAFPSLPEQTAIAEVLTEMDAELAALEQRREKTRALKQAMMQELLTGRTRLV